MEDNAKSVTKKKGNKTTEIVIGAGAAKLESAIKTLLQVAPEIEKLSKITQEGTLEVVNLEDKIGGLKQDLTNKTAQNKIELQQAYDADQALFAEKYLQANNLTAIKGEELSELQDKLMDATDNLETNVAKAVNGATSAMKKEHENAVAIAKLEFEKKEAENNANLKQMGEQVKFLTEQVGYWKKALEDERTASVERAKAASIGTLNVGQR